MRIILLAIVGISSLSFGEILEENFGAKQRSSVEVIKPTPTPRLSPTLETGGVDEIDAYLASDKPISKVVVVERSASAEPSRVFIPEDKVSNEIYEDSDDAMGNDKIISKVKLKEYPKVKYKKSMYEYSLNNPGKTKKESQLTFKDFLENSDIDEFMFKKLLGSDETILSIKLSALYYDWYLLNPSIAENFYKLLYKKKKELKLYEKYLLADYLIRTNRGDMIHKFLQKKECAVIFKGRSNCFYYLGLDSYLNTGNRSNPYLRIAKSKNEIAQRLYRYK